MREIGHDLAGHRSKPLSEVPPGAFDAVVVLGCAETCPDIPARSRVEWGIPDPRDMSLEDLRLVRDHLAARVELLIRDLAVARGRDPGPAAQREPAGPATLRAAASPSCF
jgi:protein-tyrosine-phosphatase